MIQIVWEFQVEEDKRAEFERHYASGGSWAELFQRDPAYKGTRLLHDITEPCRYVTIDTWDDEDSYGGFRAMYAQEYNALDQEMEELTTAEKKLGIFQTL